MGETAWQQQDELQAAAAAIEMVKKRKKVQVVDLTTEGEEGEELTLVAVVPKKNEARKGMATALPRVQGRKMEGVQAAEEEEFGDLDSDDERELIRLADTVMDEWDAEDELQLVELADRVSASMSTQDVSSEQRADGGSGS
ncbi:hypothetical protein MMYC01_206510 [Madurella mycetomatis]|uniref:Uncharacterized protein n=1 Tax=Madurella mycetomatis TaxID=100816 RepID=A0A175W115_9PEZI|nr:hypothetical protein MMYC01_206510 [Madurella mycetomatis]